MIDANEKLKQGRLAALHVAIWGIVISIFAAIAAGLFFAEETESLLRRAHFAVALIGFVFTGVIVYRILTGDITEHHYRERLKAEKDAERVNAEIAELEARRALYAAKERQIYTPLPGRTAPRLPEPPARAIYNNGELASDEPDEEPQASAPALQQTARNQWRFVEREPDRQPASTPEPQEEHAGLSARGKMVITESADAYNDRIRNLAREIYSLCRDVDAPTQTVIKQRIKMTAGGLLRSNDDITRALDMLAERGLVEASRGQGIKRKWLRDIERNARLMEPARASERA